MKSLFWGPFTQATTKNQGGQTTLKLLALSFSLAVTGVSWATNDQEKLEELRVYGEQGKTDTATKLDLTVFETPQTVTAISRTQIEDFSLTTINKVLDYTHGVTDEEI